MEYHLARRFFLQHLFCRCPNLRLDAPAADGPGDRAILANQHPRALVARDRAVRVHDGGQRRALSGAPHLHNLFEQVHEAPCELRYAARMVMSIRKVSAATCGEVPLRPPKTRGRGMRPLGTPVMVCARVAGQRPAAAAAPWSRIVAARLASATPKKR